MLPGAAAAGLVRDNTGRASGQRGNAAQASRPA